VNWRIVEKMGLPCSMLDVTKLQDETPTLIIDAIFGTGLNRAPEEPFPQIVGTLRKMRIPILSVDVPSGLDCDTGKPLGPCMHAKRTVTFVAEKVGFATPQAAEYLGEIVVVDIGCPRELIEEVARGT
jgi:NAD(P)H-hydrate epimerase